MSLVRVHIATPASEHNLTLTSPLCANAMPVYDLLSPVWLQHSPDHFYQDTDDHNDGNDALPSQPPYPKPSPADDVDKITGFGFLGSCQQGQ